MPLPTPLNNNCLIEVIKEYENVSRFDENDPLKTEGSNLGIIKAINITPRHLTVASAGKIELDDEQLAEMKAMVGQTVRWEDLSETAKFDQDDKQFVLVPWWRLTSKGE